MTQSLPSGQNPGYASVSFNSNHPSVCPARLIIEIWPSLSFLNCHYVEHRMSVSFSLPILYCFFFWSCYALKRHGWKRFLHAVQETEASLSLSLSLKESDSVHAFSMHCCIAVVAFLIRERILKPFSHFPFHIIFPLSFHFLRRTFPPNTQQQQHT